MRNTMPLRRTPVTKLLNQTNQVAGREALVKALSKYSKDKKAIEWMMATVGFESKTLASSLLIQHPTLLTNVKSSKIRDRTMDKIKMLEQLGLASLELVENCRLMDPELGGDDLTNMYRQLVTLGIPPDKICAPMLAHVAEKGTLDESARRRLLDFVETVRPYRTNCEYLAASLDVPLKLAHDAAVLSPQMLVDGYASRILMVALKKAGMPVTDVLRRFFLISSRYESVEYRLAYLTRRWDEARVTAILRSSTIFQQDSYFWSYVAQREKESSSSSEKRRHDLTERTDLKRISDLANLPLDSNSLKRQSAATQRLLLRTDPARLADRSLSLQSTGLTGDDVLRYPWILTFSAEKIERAALAVREITGRDHLDVSDLPKLNNILAKGFIPAMRSKLPQFVLRELAECLDCEPSAVKDRCDNTWIKTLLHDYFEENRFSAVEELKRNVAFLKGLGFCADCLLRSCFIIFIPRESVDKIMSKVVVGDSLPMKMNAVEQDKVLNLLQYYHELER